MDKTNQEYLSIKELHEKIKIGEDADDALWQTVIAYQNYNFFTLSGLPFSYVIKQNKNGRYTGELIVSRKESSKTLTRSSIMLAFHTVLEKIEIVSIADKEGRTDAELLPAEYKGPKAVGQIFGISYIFSLFWNWGLIKVPEKAENKLRGIK